MIAKLFDPLGWVTPVTITAKILIQRLWRIKIDWDELPPDVLQTWQTIYNQMSAINGLKLPRWTGQESDSSRCEIHGFADASNVAYAAVIYLRVVSQSGEVTVLYSPVNQRSLR